jgi:hypothetical protein
VVRKKQSGGGSGTKLCSPPIDGPAAGPLLGLIRSMGARLLIEPVIRVTDNDEDFLLIEQIVKGIVDVHKERRCLSFGSGAAWRGPCRGDQAA